MACEWLRPITAEDVEWMLTHKDDHGVQHRRPFLDKTSSADLECVYYPTYFQFGPPEVPE